MKAKEKKRFNELYKRHLNLMHLYGVAEKTIEAYARGVHLLMMKNQRKNMYKRIFEGTPPDSEFKLVQSKLGARRVGENHVYG